MFINFTSEYFYIKSDLHGGYGERVQYTRLFRYVMITYDFSCRSAGSSNKYWNSDSPMVLVAGADRMRVTTIVSSVVTLSGKLCTTSSSSRGTCRIECDDTNVFSTYLVPHYNAYVDMATTIRVAIGIQMVVIL